ncbi:MAG: rhodanese-like domain-containing protein [Arcobacteraceae bacterium]
MTRLLKLICVLFLSTTIAVNAKSLRIEPEQLVSNLENFKILDTRESALYKEGHIKGALNFPISLTYEHIKSNGKLTNPIKMQEKIRELGLDIDSNVVIYDDGNFFDASRLFWTLEVYGFTNVKLLNTGYDNWEFSNYAISTTAPIIMPSQYISQINSKRLATKFTTQIATKNPNQIIIDARDQQDYIGKKSSAKRFGHIPKALNVPGSHNLDKTNTVSKLKSVDKLKELYKDIDKSKKVVLYCAIGRVAASNYFALRELDYDVSNYDASWKEWGNDLALPIVNPSKE